jgi:hypothetical protein
MQGAKRCENFMQLICLGIVDSFVALAAMTDLELCRASLELMYSQLAG